MKHLSGADVESEDNKSGDPALTCKSHQPALVSGRPACLVPEGFRSFPLAGGGERRGRGERERKGGEVKKKKKKEAVEGREGK